MSVPPLLLVPGINCTERAFAPLLPALWPLRSVSIVNHWRGNTVGAIAEAILAEAPPRFALLGFSMGGYVSFEILRRAPERVERVCFLATSARPDSEERKAQRLRDIAIAEGGHFASMIGTGFEGVAHPDNLDDQALRAVHRQMALDTGAARYADQQHTAMTRPDSRPDLGAIAVPTSVIVGEADIATGVDAAREIAVGIAGAVLTELGGAGHLVPMEQPDGVSAALVAWLTAQGA